jgi:DNA polymerase-3 subunit delta'
MTKSVESNKKIYIINNAETLNVQASNSILKFLEEPEDNIIAILITNNIYQLLSTIVSRCQIISLSKTSTNKIINLNLTEEEIANNIEIINNFVKCLEKEKIETLLLTQKLWHEKFKERKDYNKGFELLLIYYKDVLNLKLNRKLELFNNYKSDLLNISDQNTFDTIIYKINKIIELKENIKVNANQNLLLDKLIIELSRGDIDG